MVYFRKRLTAEVLGEINEMILVQSRVTPALKPEETPIEKKTDDQSDTDEPDDDDKPEPPTNGGTMIVDATCAPSQIRFPQDTALLNEAVKTQKPSLMPCIFREAGNPAPIANALTMITSNWFGAASRVPRRAANVSVSSCVAVSAS